MNFHDFNTISIIEKDSYIDEKNPSQKNQIHCTPRSWSWCWNIEPLRLKLWHRTNWTRLRAVLHNTCSAKYVQIILKWLANHVKLEFGDENRLKKYHMWLFAPHSERQDVARNALTWDLDNWGLERQTGRQQGISIFQPRYPLEVVFGGPGWKNEMKNGYHQNSETKPINLI